MAQNQAHMGDIVGISVGWLKGQQGTITGLRVNSNRCMVSIAKVNYEYDGTELKLIECVHLGVTTSDQQSDT